MSTSEHSQNHTKAISYWPYPRIVAHRGGGKLAPENTLVAMRTGAEYGHKMVEFDVTLSADDVAFLLHDDTLNRTANLAAFAKDTAWQTLATLDAGSWHSQQFAGEPLPTLAEIAEITCSLDLAVNIEIKPAEGLATHTGKLVAEAARQLFHDHKLPPLISSFSFDALLAAKHAAPELPRGYLMHEWQADWQARATELECIALHLNHELITKARIAEIKSAGLSVFVYTVNDPERAKYLLDIGVDAICTDEVALIKP